MSKNYRMLKSLIFSLFVNSFSNTNRDRRVTRYRILDIQYNIWPPNWSAASHFRFYKGAYPHLRWLTPDGVPRHQLRLLLLLMACPAVTFDTDASNSAAGSRSSRHVLAHYFDLWTGTTWEWIFTDEMGHMLQQTDVADKRCCQFQWSGHTSCPAVPRLLY